MELTEQIRPIPTNVNSDGPARSVGTSSHRIEFIDGLRGLAMLWVLGFHHWIFAGYAWLQVGQVHLFNPLEYGYLGVHLFLVISGFCLAWPYCGPTAKTLDQLTLKSFLKRRITRLGPAYYVVLIISFLPVVVAALVRTGTVSSQIWLDLTAHLFWVHNLSGEYLAGINAAMWSLGLEFQLYLLFPLFLLVRNRFGLVALVVPVVVLQLCYRHAVLPLMVDQEWTRNASIAWAVPGRMVEFVAGIATATLVRSMPMATISSRVRWGAILLWMACGAAGMTLALKHGKMQPDVDALWGVFFAVSLFLGFVLEWWRKLLEAKVLIFCGICAYSVYLVHHPIGIWLQFHFYQDESYPEFLRFAVMFVYPLLMIGAGWSCYRLLERPFMQKGKG